MSITQVAFIAFIGGYISASLTVILSCIVTKYEAKKEHELNFGKKIDYLIATTNLKIKKIERKKYYGN